MTPLSPTEAVEEPVDELAPVGTFGTSIELVTLFDESVADACSSNEPSPVSVTVVPD